MKPLIPLPPGAPRGKKGPRSLLAREICALKLGEHLARPYSERSTVTGLAAYWGDSERLGRMFVSRKNGKSVFLYRVA